MIILIGIVSFTTLILSCAGYIYDSGICTNAAEIVHQQVPNWVNNAMGQHHETFMNFVRGFSDIVIKEANNPNLSKILGDYIKLTPLNTTFYLLLFKLIHMDPDMSFPMFSEQLISSINISYFSNIAFDWFPDMHKCINHDNYVRYLEIFRGLFGANVVEIPTNPETNNLSSENAPAVPAARAATITPRKCLYIGMGIGVLGCLGCLGYLAAGSIFVVKKVAESHIAA